MSREIIRRSQLQERRVAKDLKGRVQPASGAMSHAKGDVRTVGELRAECKTTSARSYSLKLSEWQKIRSEATRGNLEVAAMQIEFQGTPGMNTKLAVIDWDHFLQLVAGEKMLDEIVSGTHPDYYPHAEET